ncbi:MAG: SBBP repeat-containing protein, partial [Chloroflexota bacterium]|nr:SBBP repeat-containing protein [Chloroflexota bacterium]
VGDFTLPLLTVEGTTPDGQPATLNVEPGTFDVISPFAPAPSLPHTAAQTQDDPDDLYYATFIGGSDSDWGWNTAMDEGGAAYVAGDTSSSDFPTTPGVFDTTYNGDEDTFVAKLNATGNGLEYATFIGGSSNDSGYGITVDEGGAAYVTGSTSSPDFPTTPGAFDTTYSGGYNDVFVAKLNATGNGLEYSTFIGGGTRDLGWDIVVDEGGAAYVAGDTSSPDFPTTPGAFDTTYNGSYDGIYDAFVVKLNAAGSDLEYATFIGGSDSDHGYDIAVNVGGAAYVTGSTSSSDFPTTPGAFDTTYNGGSDAFVVKLNATGSGLEYATLIGGSDSDQGWDIVVDEGGAAYVAGHTSSPDFPTTPGAFDTTYNGGYYDVFVVKLNAAGSSLEYATFLGGSTRDWGPAIAVDGGGATHVTGSTDSFDFPTTPGAFDTTYNDFENAFVVKLNAAGSGLEYATFLGGSGSDWGLAISVDGSGATHVTGSTRSSDFPTTPGAFDTTHNGEEDAFVAKLDLTGLVSPTALDFGASLTELPLSVNPENAGDPWTLSENIPWLTLSSTSGTGPATVTLNVNRSGLSDATYDGTINATVGGQAVTVDVAMQVITPDVTIITPSAGSTVYHSDSLLVKAAVTFDGQALIGGRVEGSIAVTLGDSLNFDLYDDGNHEDSDVDDGIYAARIGLYGPTMMPTGGNPYSLTVAATAYSASGSDTTPINVTTSSGAPGIALEVSSPSPPFYLDGEQASITATLVYPDASVHTDTAVTVTLTAPDLCVTLIGLTNVASDTWHGTYTFPTGDWGRYYLDARADPPVGSGFVDGWGGSELYVYLDYLAVTVNPAGTGLLYGTMPLSVCVTADGARVSGATVNGLVTSPVMEDAGALDEVGTSGCYAGSYTPSYSGTHYITYYAEKPGYLGVAQSGSFAVSSQRSSLADRLREFGDSAVADSHIAMVLLESAAEDGDYFSRELQKDRVTLAAEALLDLAFAGIGGINTIHTVSTEGWKVVEVHKLPGFRFAVEEYAMPSTEAVEEMLWYGADEILQHGTGHIVSKVAMRLPVRYYATRGNPNKDIQRPLREFAQDEYETIVPGSNNLEETFAQAMGPATSAIQTDILLNTSRAIDEAPTMTLEAETAYIRDLALRQKASDWLSTSELHYRGDLLSFARERHEAEESDWFAKVTKAFTSLGLRIGAGAVCDGPCIVVVALEGTAMHAYLNDETLDGDQRMRDLALDLMHTGYDGQIIIWSNTNAGLGLVVNEQVPETPRGSLDDVRLRRTSAWGFERDVYAEVTISNPLTDSVTALYGVKAYYLTEGDYAQLSQNTVEPDGERARLLVELAPGESKTVRLYLCKHGEFDDGRPRQGDPIRFNLYAYTEKGVYLVDAEPHVVYEPEPEMDLAAANQVSVRYLSPQTPADAPLELAPTGDGGGTLRFPPTARFPLVTRVGSWPDAITYTLAIYAENPGPGPLATVISQPVPSQVTVLDAGDGLVQDGAIVWYRVIQPREITDLHVEFDYAGYGVTATLPSATLQFYEPATAAVVTISSDPLTFQAQAPLRAGADVDLLVAPDTQQTAEVMVTNLDGGSAYQGDLALHVWTITDTEVLSATTHVSLGAGASQDYNLTYTTPVEGLYVLEVSLHYGDETRSVVYDPLVVRENLVYLPVVLRNYCRTF